MRTKLAILVGRTISKLTKTLKLGGGSAAPGFYALKIDPELVEGLAQKIPLNIVITGTNGKTTTAKMLEHFAKSANLKVIRNTTGSNLERGVASTLISHANSLKNFDLGIWELDEAAFNTIVPKLNPDYIVFLNVFRDQLDRYGEIDNVVNKWRITLSQIKKETKILINADDANIYNLKNSLKNQIFTFGVKDQQIQGEFSNQQKRTAKLDWEADHIQLTNLDQTTFNLNNQLKVKLKLPGLYHIYDFLAAFSVAANLDLNQQKLIDSLSSFKPAFGRVEKLVLSSSEGSHSGYIFLIKNPMGTNQVLETIMPNLKNTDRLLIALNDNFADGTDVSWIWDIEFEKLLSASLRGARLGGRRGNLFYVSGTRANDLAVRLKYADISNLKVESNLEQALAAATQGLTGRLFILPTYTAMLELQAILVKQGIKEHYWRES